MQRVTNIKPSKDVEKRKTYSQSDIDMAIELYKDKSITTKEISELTGMPTSTISAVVKKAGIPLRHPKKNFKPVRICQYCKRTTDLEDIRFCPYCGKDIRTNEEVLIFTAKRLYSFQKFLAQSNRDDFKKVVDEVIAGIRELEKDKKC